MQICCFSLIWAFANKLNDKFFGLYSVDVNKNVKKMLIQFYMYFPNQGSIFDYYIDFKKGYFYNWNDLVEKHQFLNII